MQVLVVVVVVVVMNEAWVETDEGVNEAEVKGLVEVGEVVEV